MKTVREIKLGKVGKFEIKRKIETTIRESIFIGTNSKQSSIEFVNLPKKGINLPKIWLKTMKFSDYPPTFVVDWKTKKVKRLKFGCRKIKPYTVELALKQLLNEKIVIKKAIVDIDDGQFKAKLLDTGDKYYVGDNSAIYPKDHYQIIENLEINSEVFEIESDYNDNKIFKFYDPDSKTTSILYHTEKTMINKISYLKDMIDTIEKYLSENDEISINV